MENQGIIGVYSIQVSTYFIEKFGYQFVATGQDVSEIWLYNGQRQDYPLIRLLLHSFREDEDNIEHVSTVQASIEEALHFEASLLEISIVRDYQDENDARHVTIGVNFITDAVLLETFADLDKVMLPEDQARQKMDTAAKQLRKAQTGGFLGLRTMSFVTKITLAIISAVFVFALYLQLGKSIPQIDTALIVGSLFKTVMVTSHEYWRFITAGFVHIELWHFLMNALALINLGVIIDKIYTQRQYAIILFGSMILGNMVAYIMTPQAVAFGISGGLYGLMGAFIVYAIASGLIRNPRVRSQLVYTIMINIFISFMPGISMAGHFGGLVGGALLGLAFVKKPEWAQLRRSALIAVGIMFVFLVVMVVQNQALTEIYYDNMKSLQASLDTLGFRGYGQYLWNNFSAYFGGL